MLGIPQNFKLEASPGEGQSHKKKRKREKGKAKKSLKNRKAKDVGQVVMTCGGKIEDPGIFARLFRLMARCRLTQEAKKMHSRN